MGCLRREEDDVIVADEELTGVLTTLRSTVAPCFPEGGSL